MGTQSTIGAEENIEELSEGLSDLMSPVKQDPRGVKAGVKRGPYQKKKALDDPLIDSETLRRRLSEPKKFLLEFCQGQLTNDVHIIYGWPITLIGFDIASQCRWWKRGRSFKYRKGSPDVI